MDGRRVSNIYDQVSDAIVSFLTTRCGATFKSYQRGVLLYDDVIQRLTQPSGGGPELVFPQLWFYEGVGLGGGTNKVESPGRGLPAKRTLNRTIVIYALKPKANTPAGADISGTGASILNPLLASVEAAFVPDSENAITLRHVLPGGLFVSNIWIEGDVYSIPGDIDPSGLAMMTVPVKILIP
jgi:hypothetical protein